MTYVLAAMCLGVIGCQSEDPTAWLLDGLVPPSDARRLGYSSSWRRDLRMPRNTRIASAQVLGDLLLIVEAPTSFLTAIDMASGEVKWTRRVGHRGEQISPPVRVDQRILVNTQTRLFTLDALSGETKQIHDLDSVAVNSPVIFRDLAIFGGSGGRVFAQEINTGRTRWAYQLKVGIDVRPALHGTDLLVADKSGAFKLLSVVTGQPLWSGRTFARNSAQPLMTRYGVFVASEDTNLYALDTVTGKDRWTYSAGRPLHQDPKLIGEILYLPMGRRGLAAFDAPSGRRLWTVEDDQINQQIVPVIDDGRRQIMWARPRLITVETATGRLLDAAFVGQLQRVLAGPDGSLVFITDSGRIERLSRGG